VLQGLRDQPIDPIRIVILTRLQVHEFLNNVEVNPLDPIDTKIQEPVNLSKSRFRSSIEKQKANQTRSVEGLDA